MYVDAVFSFAAAFIKASRDPEILLLLFAPRLLLMAASCGGNELSYSVASTKRR